MPEKQPTESETDANDSPKEPVVIEVIEDTRNEENITVIAIDQILQIELFLLIFITYIHDKSLSMFFLAKIKLKYIGLCRIYKCNVLCKFWFLKYSRRNEEEEHVYHVKKRNLCQKKFARKKKVRMINGS